MDPLIFRGFGGMRPRVAPRLLPEMAAQRACNVKLQSGNLRPLNEPEVISTPAKTMPPLSIFRARNGTSSAAWLTWPGEVDAVRVPLSIDVESRFCWTGEHEPKMGTYTNVTSGGGNDYPKTYFMLGFPNPQTAPTVTPSGGTGVNVSRLYVYTFFSANGEETGPSPANALTTNKIDATWAISGMDAFPANSGVANGFFSSDTLVVNTENSAKTITGATNASPISITTSAPHGYATGAKVVIKGVTGNTAANNTYANPYWTITVTGASTFTLDTSTGNGVYINGGTADKVAYHWLRTGEYVVLSATTLAVASVPTAYTFTVAGNYSAATTWARETSWNTSSMKRRLYRSAGTNATFQLVHDDVSASYNDTLTDLQIMGDELISEGWKPPPVDLHCVAVHPSGALVALSGNKFYASEPYQPHAWPDAYQIPLDFNAVALAVFGSSVGICTTGNPYVISGTDPSSMTPEKFDGAFPGLAKRSMIGAGDGALYASKHGIIALGVGGPQLFSGAFFTVDEWGELNPDTMVFEAANGRLYVSYEGENGVRTMFVLDGEYMIGIDVVADELYADVGAGDLYLGTIDGIGLFDSPDRSPLNGGWKSRRFTLPKPANIGAAKIAFQTAINPDIEAAITAARAAAQAANAVIIAAGNPVGGFNASQFNGRLFNGSLVRGIPELPVSNSVVFNLYDHNDVLRATRTVTSDRVFRLPSGFKLVAGAIEVLSQCEIDEVRIAETPKDLERL